MDRRKHPRRKAYIPVSIDTDSRKERFGITRNVSVLGIQFHSRSAFSVGERVEIALHGRGFRASGVVVRAERETADPFSTFPHVTAVRLEGQLPISVFSR